MKKRKKFGHWMGIGLVLALTLTLTSCLHISAHEGENGSAHVDMSEDSLFVKKSDGTTISIDDEGIRVEKENGDIIEVNEDGMKINGEEADLEGSKENLEINEDMEAITYTGKEKNLVVYQDSDEQIETTSRPDFLQATFAMGSVEDGICMKKYKHVDANLMIPIANVKEGEEFTFEYKTDVKKGRCAFAILSPDGHLIDKKDPVKNEKGKIIFQAPGEYHIHFVAEDMEGSFIYTDPEE